MGDAYEAMEMMDPKRKLPAPAPKVQILHQRDPDSECYLTVWIDGKQVAITDECDIDPGHGYDAADWWESTRVYATQRDEFETAAYAAMIEASDSNYITGDPDWVIVGGNAYRLSGETLITTPVHSNGSLNWLEEYEVDWVRSDAADLAGAYEALAKLQAGIVSDEP